MPHLRAARRTGPRSATRPRWSVARQVVVIQLLLVVLVVGAGAALAYWDARADSRLGAERRVTAIGQTVADNPAVAEALTDPDPSAFLQPYAEQVRRDTGVDFVVVMDPDRTRWSHPNAALIGQPFLGTIGPALAGNTFTEEYAGTLGPSVRVVVPVLVAGRVVGLVSVGITTAAVGAEVARSVPALLLASAAVLLVALLGAAAVGRRLRRLTFGLGAEELGRMYRYYDAVLHSAREGLLLLDADGRIQLVNDEARRLLDLDGAVTGRCPADLGLPPALAAALAAGNVADEIHLTADRVVVVSAAPARSGDVDVGRIVTLRDHTEVQELAGELDTNRRLADALRSQAHEAANRMHTVVSLIELGRSDEAVGLVTGWIGNAQDLADRVLERVDEPVVAALLLGKSAVAAEQGVDLLVTPDSELDPGALIRTGAGGPDVVTILGNLIDNAVEAVAGRLGRQWVAVTVRIDGADLLLRVADSGPGLDAAAARHAFERGWSSKAGAGRLHGRGLGLALVGQTVARLGGRIDVSRHPTAAPDPRTGPAGADEMLAGPDSAAVPAPACGPSAADRPTDGLRHPDSASDAVPDGLGGAVFSVRLPLREVVRT